MLSQIKQGRFANHPLHPIVVHLPVGLWVASFVFDIVHFITGSGPLGVASYYCIMLGIIGAVIAAAAGMIEYVHIASGTRPKDIATRHLVLNVVALIFFVVSLVLRQNVLPELTGTAFVMSLIGVAVLSYSGYLGGVLVYEYGIGRNPIARDPERKGNVKNIGGRVA